MRPEPDAFITAVDAATERLARAEGRRLSMREVLRRAGADDSMRAKVFYHLNRQKDWPRGHKIPPEVVDMLASVLPDPEELRRAAQVAAGFDVVLDVGAPATGGDARRVVARVVGDITEQELLRLGAEVNQLIADELLRRQQQAASA